MSIVHHRLGRGINRAAALLLAATLLAPAAQAVQVTTPPVAATRTTPPPAVEEEEVIVTGVRQQLELIPNFVQGLTVADWDGPLTRYQPDTYCPAAVGLSASRNAEIVARMRTVAAAAKVVPAKPGCRPSAMVIFVDDKPSFLAAFRKRHPVYFSSPADAATIKPREDGPAAAWQLVQEFDPQGAQLARRFGNTRTVESPAGGSRLLSMITKATVMSVVVVERRALIGLTAIQIADYALMRTLTDRPPAIGDVPDQLTILRALQAPVGSVLPASITRWDLAYVQGRYYGHPAEFGTGQSASIQRSMKRAVRGQKKGS